MGNCTSCVTSHAKVNDFGCHDNALHIIAEDVNGNHKVGSVHSEQGAKGANQDAAVLFQGYGLVDGTFCGVFDGHGEYGHVVSRVVRNQLPSLLLHQKRYLEWEEAFVNAFKAMDKVVKLHVNVDCSLSGTTAVVVVKQREDLFVANLGDSRAVLGSLTDNGIQAIQLTVDLKPDVPAEADRIEKSNGRVFAHETQPHIPRVWFPNGDAPGLAMSRAFGDFDMKHYGIIVTPDVSQHHLTSNDHFVVLASDGVWDVLTNEEVVSIVWSAKSKQEAAKAVIQEAHASWKRKFPKSKVDDCSVVCLFLQEESNNILPLPPST